MDPYKDKLIRRTTMVGTVVAAYFLLTADYGPQPNVLDPIKNAILSVERSVKEAIFGSKRNRKEVTSQTQPRTVLKGIHNDTTSRA